MTVPSVSGKLRKVKNRSRYFLPFPTPEEALDRRVTERCRHGKYIFQNEVQSVCSIYSKCKFIAQNYGVVNHVVL